MTPMSYSFRRATVLVDDLLEDDRTVVSQLEKPLAGMAEGIESASLDERLDRALVEHLGVH